MKRNDIQIIRAISVLAVVGYHAAPERMVFGYLGVDVFFVISGFVVTPRILTALQKDDYMKSGKWKFLREFYKRRFFRLTPTLFTTSVASVPLILIFIAPRDFEKFFGQMTLSVIGLGNVGAWWFSGDYFSPHPSPLLHTWSLAVEEQIYFLLPLFLILIIKFSNGRITSVTRRLITIMAAVSFALNIGLEYFVNNRESISQFIFYSPITRFYEFGLGAFVATSVIAKKKRNNLSLLPILLLGFVLVFPNQSHLIALFLVLLLTVITLSFGNEKLELKFLNPLVEIGNQSYSIYLFHMPLLFIAFYSPVWPDTQHREGLKLLAVAILFPIAYVNYRFVEKKWILKGASIGGKDFRNCVIKWIVVPFILSCILFVGSNHSFFGLDPNQKPLPDPALMIGKCYSLEGKAPCILTDKTYESRILLIGDSHARHLSVTFRRAAIAANSTPVSWTQSGCQFILPETLELNKWKTLVEKYGIVHKGESQSCFEHNQQIINWLSRNKSDVLLTFRSTSMVQNDLGIDPNIYRNLLIKNFQILGAHARKLIIIGPNPEYLDHSRFFGGGTLIWQSEYEPDASIKVARGAISANAFKDNDYLAKRLAKSRKVSFINGINPFCNERSCIRKLGRNWLYTDVDHLSVFGTDLYLNQLTQLIKTE